MSNFEGTPVRTLDDLIQFNLYHAELELPPGEFCLLPLFSMPPTHCSLPFLELGTFLVPFPQVCPRSYPSYPRIVHVSEPSMCCPKGI